MRGPIPDVFNKTRPYQGQSSKRRDGHPGKRLGIGEVLTLTETTWITEEKVLL